MAKPLFSVFICVANHSPYISGRQKSRFRDEKVTNLQK